MSINHLDASAPYKIIFEAYGLTVDYVIEHAHNLMGKNIRMEVTNI